MINHLVKDVTSDKIVSPDIGEVQCALLKKTHDACRLFEDIERTEKPTSRERCRTIGSLLWSPGSKLPLDPYLLPSRQIWNMATRCLRF